MKTCFKCLVEKEINCFYKHSQMRDGRLNKCTACTVKGVSENRNKDPLSRAKEHIRNREKKGFMTRAEYHQKIAEKAIGRKTSSLKYSYKRRRIEEKSFQTEIDIFVFEEAKNLCQLRDRATGFKWHIDHIVPVFHKLACGLNTAYNFQVVPAKWNVIKGNRNMNTYFNI